jgi:hypothetical protein
VITLSYTPGNAGNTSGTLTVSSGGHLVASIEMIGTYSTGNFHSGPGISGTVEITYPGVVHGGGIQLGGHHALRPRHNVDLPEIAFYPSTTLAFARNGGDVGGMLGVVGGTHAARLGLLANYVAASFVAAGDDHGCAGLTEKEQTIGVPRLLLAAPRSA